MTVAYRGALIGSILVLLGGLIVSPLPDAVWAADLPGRDSTTGRMLALSVVVAGLGLGAWAWLRCWAEARANRAELGDVHKLTALATLPLLVAPPLFSRDGWSYVAQGELAFLGLNPYRFGPWILDGPISDVVDERWMWTPAPYGPLPLWHGELLARVAEDPWIMVIGHRLLAVAGIVLLAWALPRLARWSGRNPVVVSAMALPAPIVLAHGVGGLHNDLLLVGLVAAALAVAVDHGWLPAAGLIGLAAAVKLTGGLAGLGIVLVTLPAAAGMRARLRRGFQVGAVSVATLMAVGFLAGVGQGWAYTLSVPLDVRTPLSVTAMLDLLIPGFRNVGVVAALIFAAAVGLRAPTGNRVAALHATTLVLAVTVFLSPVVHPWYALWFLPLAAACQLSPRWAAAAAWLALSFGISAPLNSSLSGLPVHIGVTTVLVIGVVLALTGRLRPAYPPLNPPSSTTADPSDPDRAPADLEPSTRAVPASATRSPTTDTAQRDA